MLALRRIPITLALLAATVLLLVALIPPEATLGWKIRVVLLHGALARTGLTIFAAASLAGILSLAWNRPGLAEWLRTLQLVALGAWILYLLSSVLATWLTWERPFAWAEPRTQASLKILVMAIVFLFMARWIARDWFVALLNVVAGPVAIFLVRTAAVVQHPVDPVMDANAVIFPVLFLSIWVVLVAIAAQATRWIHATRGGSVSEAKAVGRSPG